MTNIGIDMAQAELPALMQRVSMGEEFTVTGEDDTPLAKIVPCAARQLDGFMKGRIWVAPDFDDPLPEFAPYET